jgi:hypothetical protein
MEKVKLPLNKIEIIEAQNILRKAAKNAYNQSNEQIQMDYQMQYDFAKDDRKIQRMGGTFDDFLRFTFDYTICRIRKNGKIEYEIKPNNLRRIIMQRARNFSKIKKKIIDDYTINLPKYWNGEISSKEFRCKYQSCKKALSTKQRELNKLQKLLKSLE